MTQPKPDAPAELEFDAETLDHYLRDKLPEVSGQLRLERIGGGQSNPTFFVDYDNRAMVLRKKPAGDILQSAHAVDREYRIMDALANSEVPVPEMILYEDDEAVVGTPFYLMKKLDGRVFPDYSLPGIEPEDRRRVYFSMAETMAALHQVDWRAVGLEGFGKPGDYFTRQIRRWSKQWAQSKTRENPWIDQLIEWLPENIPDDDESTICHGDYRMGNLMFHPTEPRVIAVLDWELSTIGHPLADVAYNCMAYRTLPSEYGGMKGLDLDELGIPQESEYLAYYDQLTGRGPGGKPRVQPFHYAFSLFRFAVIFEGIAARAAEGNAASDNAAEVAKLAPALARRAVEISEEQV